MEDRMMRETGSGTAACPDCGRTLTLVPAPDGSISPELCPKCNPATNVEKAEKKPWSAPTLREIGTEPQAIEEGPADE